MRYFIAFCSTMLLLLPARGQDASACSTTTIRGTYSVVCTGFLTPAPNASQVPASLIGTITSGMNGVFTGSTKLSLGGTIVDQTVTGTAIVNDDCTGSVSYDQKINGQAAPKLNIAFHILNFGAEMKGMSVDQGATLVCKLTLMRRN